MKMFGLLSEGKEELATAIAQENQGRFDDWSSDIVLKYKDQERGLQSEDLNAELRHTAYHLDFENAPVEARHAGVRRSIIAASTHTHTHTHTYRTSPIGERRLDPQGYA